jgi:hypothetical protein
VYKIFAGKPVGKIILGIAMHRQEDNIKIDLRELQNLGVWNGYIPLRTGTRDRLL